ncbi:peptidoglycan hydrolase-like protein with peptidoglycan-binding domain [Deinococcus budaensis]|uniref:Peptidoglycan hydrolase-like protein with peptidoglycan-binding domain n=1 Tax=Deinococcus budaensis TaxID=1665626 RepID=A0A7W8GFI9_9DEIO|nr:peptidoglycan-binding protein [Deinococcus budaensis]MBB5234716.1 peptidoglycan hydrolase-like protein with peptidoglycan-binding domain [Deinococcus budaensis]
MMRSTLILAALTLSLSACGVQRAQPAAATPPDALLGAQSVLTWQALRSGDSGRDVVTLQYLLRHAGQSLSVDGAFGGGTDTAVRNFQRANGLVVDGTVGGNTWEKLIVTVRQGDSNNAVRAVQDQLRSGYGYSAVTVDGVFGSGTNTALRDFQSRRGLTVDGVAGLNTWHALVTGSSTGATGTTASLASQILNSGRVTLGTSSSTSGGNPRQNVVDTANGLAARRGCAGDANCGLTVYLKRSMLQGMLTMANAGNSFFITSIAGGVHSTYSDHYAGLALDIGIWNGVSLSTPNSAHTAARNACLAAGSDPGQTFNAYYDPPGGHSNHVHCAWN